MPAAWAGPGTVTRLNGVATEFGPLSLEVRVADDGRSARVRIDPPGRSPARRIVLHLGGWAAADAGATIELPTAGPSERTVPLR
jgi:hypothetical protein